MMGPIKVKSFGAVPRRLRGVVRQAERLAAKKALEHWHRVFRPEHFEATAVRRYGYAPRAPGYQKWKAKRLGHQKPLVKTGRGRRATDVRRIQYVRRGSGARLVMSRARVFNLTNPGRGNRVDMRSELLTITRAEDRALIRIYNDELMQQISLVQGASKLTIE